MPTRYTEYGKAEADRIADEAVMARIAADFKKWYEDSLAGAAMLSRNKRLAVEGIAEVWLAFGDEVRPLLSLIQKEG